MIEYWKTSNLMAMAISWLQQKGWVGAMSPLRGLALDG